MMQISYNYAYILTLLLILVGCNSGVEESYSQNHSCVNYLCNDYSNFYEILDDSIVINCNLFHLFDESYVGKVDVSGYKFYFRYSFLTENNDESFIITVYTKKESNCSILIGKKIQSEWEHISFFLTKEEDREIKFTKLIRTVNIDYIKYLIDELEKTNIFNSVSQSDIVSRPDKKTCTIELLYNSKFTQYNCYHDQSLIDSMNVYFQDLISDL